MPTCNLPMLTYTCYARVPLSRHWPRLSPTMCLSKYVCITTIKYKHHPRRTTDQEEQLTTTTYHDVVFMRVFTDITRIKYHITSTLFRLHLWEIMWQTRCDMFKVTHRHDFVSQEVYRQTSFSVWTRAWTRLVVDTLRGNMSVDHKVTSFMQTRASMRKFSCEHMHVSQKVV